jgi:ABC-type uncharacterized transport system involved in gliding motility auxiliary subunit
VAHFLKSRQTKYGAYAVVYTLVILAVLAAINFLANRYTKSYDSTANKQFSLADQTKNVARRLDHDVTIYDFDETTRFPQARDLLDRYAALSPKLHVKYIDPVKKPQQAQAAGFRRDVNILVDSGTKKEEAKSLTEEEVTGALIRSLKSGERNVCFLNEAGERSLDETNGRGFSYLKQILERDNYKVRAIDMKPKADATKPLAVGQAPAPANVEVPKDCTVLTIGGPQGEYPAPVVNAIKTYVEGGGRALIMLDTPVPLGRQEPAAENAELVKQLADWGVTANKDLVLDLSGVGQLFGLGPEVPLVTAYESHPITAPLTRGVPSAFPVTRSLDVSTGAKATATKLFGTTEDSVSVTGVPAGGAIDPKKGKKGPFTLGAAITLSGGSQGRVVVTGTSFWASNNLIASRQLGNRDLFGNMVNWLSSDEDLISIRPHAPEDRPLTLTAQKLSMVFWLSVVIFPLAVVGFGMTTWWKRR